MRSRQSKDATLTAAGASCCALPRLNTGNVVSDKTVVQLDAMTEGGGLTKGSGNEYNREKQKSGARVE